MLRMAVITIRGWFYYFLRGKEKRIEGEQSIIGDIPIRSSPKHSFWLTVTTFLPEKTLKKWQAFIPKPQLSSQKLSKTNTSLRCSKFAVVDHVVHSLWAGWCLFKSGILPLTLHKFIKIDSFSKLFRKTPRRAEPLPIARENPLLTTLRTKTWVMVPTWLKKIQNGQPRLRSISLVPTWFRVLTWSGTYFLIHGNDNSDLKGSVLNEILSSFNQGWSSVFSHFDRGYLTRRVTIPRPSQFKSSQIKYSGSGAVSTKFYVVRGNIFRRK